MYELFAPIAMRLGTQPARRLATIAMKLASVSKATPSPAKLKLTVMGLEFPGPAGLAAGFDKNGSLYPYLGRLGFGFAEIGTVTPNPEPGRSDGLAVVMANLAHYPAPHDIPLGVSIGMNRATPFNFMVQDYLACLTSAWQHADYITVNLGIRAGPDLHQLGNRPVLRNVLATIKEEQVRLATTTGFRRPILVKVDQGRRNAGNIIDYIQEFAFDGIVLGGKGGHRQALSALEQVTRKLQGATPVISVGDILSPQDARDRLDAGAVLLQLYTGLLQSGPRLVSRINAHC